MSASNERLAIVAGAGGELGRATAEKPAAARFTTVGVDRSEEGLKQLPDGIRRETADPAAARSVVDQIAAVVGPPLGIRVNAVAPALIDNAKNRPYLTPELSLTRSRRGQSPTSSSTS